MPFISYVSDTGKMLPGRPQPCERVSGEGRSGASTIMAAKASLLWCLLAPAVAYRLPITASLSGELNRRAVLGGVAGALGLWSLGPGQSTAGVVGLTRDYTDPDLQFSLKVPLEWFLSQRDTESSKPAFSNRPSSTILVVADYSTGATASVVQTKLGPLVGEGMGMPSMAGNIRIRKFEELLDGKGVATLLLRDRDGQLKSSYDSSQEAPPGKSDPRFLSTLVECAVQGKRMDFEVKTPVNRVKNYKSKRTVREPSEVFLMATPWIADAQPKPTPRLVRQQQDERLSKAKSFLQSDDTVLTLWVTADRRLWEDESGTLQNLLDSFELLGRGRRRRW